MRRGCLHLFPLISMLLFFSTFSYGQAWSGILAPARATNWTYAGIPGGIPSRTTICANLNAGASTSTIQTAINSCPAGQVVSFGVGTFTLSGSIYANKGIVLRGAGPTQTTIDLGSGNILLSTNGTGGEGSYPGNLGSTNWTGGLTRGSTVLTLTSTSGIHAGQNIALDQHNAAWVDTAGVEGNCLSGNSCGRNDSPLQFYGSATRAQPQMAHVVSVDSGTQITIAAPGVAFDHDSGLSPQAFYWNNGGNIQYAGIENMHVNANNNDFAISMPFCDYCWVKNVFVNNLARSAVFFFWGYGDVVRNSYFTSSLSGAPTQYGIELNTTTYTLVENNICYNVTACILPEVSFGLVVGYNYALNTVAGNQFASFSTHLSHNSFQLLEGNVMDTIANDNSWGSASQSTLFRNRAWGKGTNKTNFRVAIKFNAQQHYMNAVGNVIGDPTFHTRYRCDNVDTNTSDNFEYDLGFWNSCEAGTSSYDTGTQSSLMRWGNWDAVTWKANGNTNGVRYCTGSGAGNPACTASETASTAPPFPGLASPSTTLPASFYLPSKPSWFGSVIWPPIGPDVTCTTNCTANTANHAAMIPAQLCYTNTAKNSGGFLTAFDANACYANDSSSNNAPAPPTGLTASVQ